MGQGLTSSELNQLRGLRWSAEDARNVLASWRTSGLSMSAFGAKHGLAAQRLGWWKKRLVDWGDAPEAASSAPRLVPAIVRGSAALTDVAPVAIRLGAGIVIEVTNTDVVEPTWIAAVVGALSRPG
jgi:hypothetical protein